VAVPVSEVFDGEGNLWPVRGVAGCWGGGHGWRRSDTSASIYNDSIQISNLSSNNTIKSTLTF
jgi:hypothetical protein